MIDLHTHSFLSDGELIPAELIRRAKVKGYRVLGISDHVDHTNIDSMVRAILKIKELAGYHVGITVIPGVEITHVPPRLIGDIILHARALGISYVVVHGETLSEPVEEGTNRAAIEAGVDILAHPGLIKEEDALVAKEKGVLLEISTRKGHSLSNGHVAKIAHKIGVGLILDTDSHSPSDLLTKEEALRIARGAGLTEEDFRNMQKNAEMLVEKKLR